MLGAPWFNKLICFRKFWCTSISLRLPPGTTGGVIDDVTYVGLPLLVLRRLDPSRMLEEGGAG